MSALRHIATDARFTIGELLLLAEARSPDAEARLTTVFEWYHQRAAGTLRATAAAAAAVPTGILLGAFKDKLVFSLAAVIVAGLVTLVLTAAAIYQAKQLSHLHREYLLSVRLLRALQQRVGP